MNVETMLKAATKHWPKVAPLAEPITSARAHKAAVKLLDAVLDAGGANEAHPLASLAALLGERIEAYETAHRPMREMTSVELLRQLMEERGIKQSELPEIGAQSVVSAVLSGKRKLNLGQVRRLAERFSVPMEALVG